jgi:hypothetical protein
MFGVALEILWDVWWCCGDSVGCLVSLWGFLERLQFSWRFCGICDDTTEFLWDIWCCHGDFSVYLKLLWGIRSRDSAVGIATGYGLNDRGFGVRVPIGSRVFSSPRRPDRLWGSPNLLSNGYLGRFPRGKAARA